MLFVIDLGTSAQAAVKPNPLFSDGTVLQQEPPIPVWGTANDGEKVTVKFDGHAVSATAKNGKGRVDLPAPQAGGPLELVVSGENKYQCPRRSMVICQFSITHAGTSISDSVDIIGQPF